MLKPGYRTSEFWFTLVSFIFSGLYLTGMINDHSNKEELISIVSHAVESCILIGGQFVILYNYINTRKNVKIEEASDEPTRKPTRKNNKSRTNTKRSRKTNSNN